MPLFAKGHKGYKPKGAISHKNRAKRELLLKHAQLSIASTIESIRRGLQYDPRALFRPDGTLKPITELSEAEAWAIAGFDIVRRNLEGGDGHTDTIVKIRLVDRGKYVELAAKHQGLLTEKVELSGDDALIQALYVGRARAIEARKTLNVLPNAHATETGRKLLPEGPSTE